MPIDRYHQARCVIENGETVSLAVNILGWRVVAVATPATITGTSVTFQVDPGDGTYRVVEDYDGDALTSTIEASKVVQIGDDTQPAPWIVGANAKVVSQGAEGGDRELWLLCVAL